MEEFSQKSGKFLMVFGQKFAGSQKFGSAKILILALL